MTNTMFDTALNTLINDNLFRERCFSAGELATILRHRDPTLVFSVSSISEILNEMFESKELLYEDGMGYPTEAVRVRRFTSGSGRVRAGIPVWVYGPSLDDVKNHPFEVDIPLPGGQKALAAQDDVIDVTPIPAPLPVVAAPTEEALIRAALQAHTDETTLQAARRMRLSMESLKASAMAQITLLQTL
ncbi:MAG: hypothetical protein E6R03_09480 [Hyphomicrobiaceae bacterium]|nr:MAG: hypothetical protein E6R03_09480 [Hyphomicrobiaceae bacterium]